MNRIGMEACRRGRLKEAEAHLLEALELARKATGSCTELKLQNNLGIVCELRGDARKAMHHYERALSLIPAKASADHPLRERIARSLARVCAIPSELPGSI